MPTAATLLEAFGKNFPGLTQLLTAFAYLIGMWAGVSGVAKLWRRYRFEPDATAGSILSRFFLCAVLLYLPTAVDSGREAVFAGPYLLTYGYGAAVSESGKVVVKTVLDFVRLVGLGAFIYGFVLINRAHQRHYDPGLSAKGVTHVVGGILGINIVATLKMLAATFGLEKLLEYIIV